MSDQDTRPPLYAAVLATFDRLVKNGNGTTFEEIGTEAWRNITASDQLTALPFVLGAYAHRIHEEEDLKSLTERAADRTHTYLEADDTASLWDSALDDASEDGDVPASRQALINVLCELELLQHRLGMRDEDGGSTR